MDESAMQESTHGLLLALAGRVDDDTLAWARELLAVGEDTRAIELVTASLAADGTGLPAPVRAALVDAARAARIDLDADAALAPVHPHDDHDDLTEHRFAVTAPAGADVVLDAVRALPARQLEGFRVQLAWRLTPAGAAPGPLPHPVLLVEVEPGGLACDVLAYQVAAALERAGVIISVEVLTAGRLLTAYHRAAEADAVTVSPDHDAGARPRPVEHARPPAEDPPAADRAAPDLPPADLSGVELFGGAPSTADRPAQRAARPEPEPAFDAPRQARFEPVAAEHREAAPPAAPPAAAPPAAAPSSPPAGEPAVVDADAAATDPTGTVLAAAPPAEERDVPVGPAPPRPMPLRFAPDGGGRRRKPDPANEATTELPSRPLPRPNPTAETRRRPTVTPISRTTLPSPIPLVRRDALAPRPLAPVGDTVDEQPAMQSLADAHPAVEEKPAAPEPTEREQSEPRREPALSDTPTFASMQDPLSGPLKEPLLAPLLDPTVSEDDEDPYDAHGGISPLAPDAPGPVEDRWASEWASGDWAMSPFAVDEPASDTPEPGRPDPRHEESAADDTVDDGADEESDFGSAESGSDDAAAPVPRAARHRHPDETVEDRGSTDDAQPENTHSEDTRQADPAAEIPEAAPLAEPVERAAEPPRPDARAGIDRPAERPVAPADDDVTGYLDRPAAHGLPRRRAGIDRGQAPAASQPPRPAPGTEAGSPPAAPSPAPRPAPVEPVDDEAAGAGPDVEHADDQADLGLHPQSVARLSDADRELLARLQAELGAGRKPKVSRRAGVAGGTNGTATNGNGNGPHRVDPPDLAG